MAVPRTSWLSLVLPAFCAAGAATLSLSACAEGDFDQRLRADIDAQREDAFDDINSNPTTKHGKVSGEIGTGGPLTSARVSLMPVDVDGTLLDDEDDSLGNTITALSKFGAHLQSKYEGPVIVAVRGFELSGSRTTYAHPALGDSSPRVDMADDDELLGFVLDAPNALNARAITPLTTLAVERAVFLGGLSSGNLSIASRQVAEFFGFTDTRDSRGDDLTDNESLESSLAINLAQAAISQIARNANVPPANVWRALRLDIRDDGEMNGSAGLIPGSASALPDLTAVGIIGTDLLREGWLAADNEENVSTLNIEDVAAGGSLDELLDFLDTPREFSDTTPEIEESSQEFASINLEQGETASLGIRAFDRVGVQIFLVVSSDGPTPALLEATSSDPDICAIDADNRLSVPLTAENGDEAEITVRLRPDGIVLTGDFDRTFTIRVTVK
ncbi:MAG: hypothetical protein L6Q71_09480 [Planctomycetes bacterium]|nr:hypothetical protein [Planctomycetota bacterium]